MRKYVKSYRRNPLGCSFVIGHFHKRSTLQVVGYLNLALIWEVEFSILAKRRATYCSMVVQLQYRMTGNDPKIPSHHSSVVW